MKKVIGILGGMGPGATVDAFSKLVSHTPAKKDQEHIPVIIASLPGIPDRTESIIHDGPSPLPSMLNSLKLLESAGASCIIMPCNTAHFWYEDLKRATQAIFLNIIDVTSHRIVSDKRDNVAVLATTATVRSGLYQKKLLKEGVNCIVPDDINQQKIMQSIMAYKAGDFSKAYEIMVSYVKKLECQGVNTFIMGCTEIPLILNPLTQFDAEKFIDTTEELIKEAIKWYYDDSRSDFRKNIDILW
ncbi:amino acid racemase [Klebsiella variicola]|uniref:Aspartate/glutamate racemase family protein n=1 Tax=Klebsiella michiganensis TaxID=1134687 RepID=A0A6P1V5C8_9ENTR|nr:MULTISPECIES: amino acid racemase [Klebsiella]MCC5458513.1 amino acid racemase [Klebsiella variicola]QHS49774.1 aspartate/glutamate racemase family protein [Klebsiella michiganensis]VUS85948.1 Aspartate racemase [Klebsiella pasteurii]HDX8940693.1 aspartate/glutamate racemase family protein [Klebsiella michiganensis]